MKKLLIRNCGSCPNCKVQRDLFGEWIHVCQQTCTRVTLLDMPENCPLPDNTEKKATEEN